MTEDVGSRIVVRQAEPCDLPAIVEIYRDLGRHHAALEPGAYRVPGAAAVRDRFARVLDEPRAGDAHFVAEVNDVVVGQLSLYAEPATGDGSIRVRRRAAEVGIAVRDGWRGRGVGTALMRAAEAWARSQGLDLLLLSVDTTNADAARLYQRLGYRVRGQEMELRLSHR